MQRIPAVHFSIRGDTTQPKQNKTKLNLESQALQVIPPQAPNPLHSLSLPSLYPNPFPFLQRKIERESSPSSLMEEEGGLLELLSSADGGEDGFLLGCSTTSHMLCFGAGASSESSLTSLSSSPPPTITTSSTVTTTISKSTKKGGSSGGGGGRRGATGGTNNNSSCGSPGTASKKKARIITESSSPTSGTMRVRKEKLGERIMALQQLVSPFGKSDTASVLHEALGYIRFLHDQVQVLSLPYMQSLATPADNLHDGGGGEGELRRRGLCLVPVSCTENVANNNGADIWSPSSMGSNISSAAKN